MKDIVTQINVQYNNFIKKATEIHKNKYDYSAVEYINKRTKVSIICSKHGIFFCTPGCHIQKRGCPKCGVEDLKGNIETFILKADQTHNNEYDYSKSIYIDYVTPLIINCREHGEFTQKPREHLKRHGCPKCGRKSSSEKLKTSHEELLEKFKIKHDDKYDYSKVDCVNNQTKVEIVCKKHGIFKQSSTSHLSGKGCPQCGNSVLKTLNKFIPEANSKHNNKYDYSKVDYINSQTKIEIICKEHGSFYQTPFKHLSYSYGCPQCGGSVKSTTKEFKDKAEKVHKKTFEYEKVDYTNNKTKVIITCDKHGDFEQLPNSHLMGHGCPKCYNKITKPHQKIIDILDSNNIKHENNVKNLISDLEIDIFVHEYNFGIEVNGLYWHSLRNDNIENHYRIKNLHNLKATLAEQNGIKLYQFWDFEINNKIGLVNSMILHSLGKSNKIYARQFTRTVIMECCVRESKQSREPTSLHTFRNVVS